MGVQGIKLDKGNSLLDILPITNDTREICSITTSGLVKRTQIKDFIIAIEHKRCWLFIV